MHNRHSIRLQKHDYSLPQTLFITLGAYKHACIFGDIRNDIFISNEIGKIIENWISKTIDHFNNITLDTFQIMPNHIHMILKINYQSQVTMPTILGRGDRAPTHHSLGQI